MDESFTLLLAFGAGGFLGAMFFGGLWWTVRKSLGSTLASAWLFGGFLLRTGVTLAGFYFVGRGHWERLIVCLVGFWIARLIVTWLTRSTPWIRHAH